jgi:hypothetical protein
MRRTVLLIYLHENGLFNLNRTAAGFPILSFRRCHLFPPLSHVEMAMYCKELGCNNEMRSVVDTQM